MRFVAKAMLDGRCICEIDEYGGPPEPIRDIQNRLCRKVAAWVLTEWGEVVDHCFVERFQGNEQVWDKRDLKGGTSSRDSDHLELLRDGIDGIDGLEFVRYSECSLRVTSRPERLVWVLPPNDQHPTWRVCFSGDRPRQQFDTLNEVLAWLREQRGESRPPNV